MNPSRMARSLLFPVLVLGFSLVSTASLSAQNGRCRHLGGGCTATSMPMMRCSRLPNVGCQEFALFLWSLGVTFPSGMVLVGACRHPSQPVVPPLACAAGCELLVGTSAIALPFQADRFGVAFLPVPVPNIPALVGMRFCAQAVRFDPGCFSLSDAIQIRIGRGGCS